MNSTVVFAKLQQNYIWNKKELKPKHRVTKMSEEEWNKIPNEFKLVNNEKGIR